jgi:hypothetical protein
MFVEWSFFFQINLRARDLAGDKVGGIWSHVNSTSGLQLNSVLYRFHPAVLWSRGFPFRDEILNGGSRFKYLSHDASDLKVENRSNQDLEGIPVGQVYTLQGKTSAVHLDRDY